MRDDNEKKTYKFGVPEPQINNVEISGRHHILQRLESELFHIRNHVGEEMFVDKYPGLYALYTELPVGNH